MSSLIQRLLPAPGDKREAGCEPRLLSPRVLVISADVRLYAAVLSAVNSRVWDADWVRSVFYRKLTECRLIRRINIFTKGGWLDHAIGQARLIFSFG
jgi:hypothetical protein